MSKAPGDVKDYDGSGTWFKTFDWGGSIIQQWLSDYCYTHVLLTLLPSLTWS